MFIFSLKLLILQVTIFIYHMHLTGCMVQSTVYCALTSGLFKPVKLETNLRITCAYMNGRRI